MGWRATVSFGNASQHHRRVIQRDFDTQKEAESFAVEECAARGSYHYWVTKRTGSDFIAPELSATFATMDVNPLIARQCERLFGHLFAKAQ